MASESQEYATSVRRETCGALAKELVGSDQIVPVAVQGDCSYTVYAGEGLGQIVQFRLKSLGYADSTCRRFFALAWKALQKVNQSSRDRMAETFETELQILLVSLPDRFHPIIRNTLASLPSILSLPMVLYTRTLNGWIRYEDYRDLARLFWEEFGDEIGGLSDGTSKAVKAARVSGLLRPRGFTSRLANMPKPVPIKDDDSGRNYGNCFSQ
ncbi:hypothetical protein B0T26DRAFT_678786 [Lasiosphaeria miniovina]|uniref:Uncharacterized protein n=1 Tax=Lasiosphaeria miniovina TaxID=1954250 RepID=A0AA40A546_9PEZI|nr:uncharacterized protein B0T26DRAFT_678786 [Lasiosphaeria miniovina]KAK0709350.1 hypothetical protein B0T26DRAFT_678786 [Lasiosphaeria miniovina]